MKPRIIIVIEGGLVQNVVTDTEIDCDVLDHDWFENCFRDRSGHADDCTDHTVEDLERYLALRAEADALDGVSA